MSDGTRSSLLNSNLREDTWGVLRNQEAYWFSNNTAFPMRHIDSSRFRQPTTSDDGQLYVSRVLYTSVRQVHDSFS